MLKLGNGSWQTNKVFGRFGVQELDEGVNLKLATCGRILGSKLAPHLKTLTLKSHCLSYQAGLSSKSGAEKVVELGVCFLGLVPRAPVEVTLEWLLLKLCPLKG